jgi:excisionase family DNA binding protein
MTNERHRAHCAKPFRRPVQRELAPLSEAAAILSRSPRTLRRWIERGDLPAHRLQGRLLVKIDDVRALILTSRVMPRRTANGALRDDVRAGAASVHSSAQQEEEAGAASGTVRSDLPASR